MNNLKELLLANKELAFRNEAQEKKLAEQTIANDGLVSTNAEKEKELQKYKYFFYQNLDLACFANLGGYFEELNENFTKVLGYTTKDLLEKRFFDFIHPDDVAPTFKVMEELALGYHTVSFVNRFKTKTDSYRYLEWNSIVNLETKKIYAIARDVTDRILANKELVYQNEEKEKRAAELIIANTELVYQNAEKEKRAAELIIANTELIYQNEEKEKRAAELIIANIELDHQNSEKEKRTAELIAANQELKLIQGLLKENILGLEAMMFITSHKVRQPIVNIIGIANMLDGTIESPEELKKIIGYMKQSALSLDASTKDLTLYISKLEKNVRNRNAA